MRLDPMSRIGFYHFPIYGASYKRQLYRLHPLNRYAEVFSALETRITLLSMTYKKYIEMRLCCFIPGRVLDIGFGILERMHEQMSNERQPFDILQVAD